MPEKNRITGRSVGKSQRGDQRQKLFLCREAGVEGQEIMMFMGKATEIEEMLS